MHTLIFLAEQGDHGFAGKPTHGNWLEVPFISRVSYSSVLDNPLHNYFYCKFLSHFLTDDCDLKSSRTTLKKTVLKGFLGSKITADGDCRHEMKRHLLLGRKVMTNLDSILKSRDITLPTKIRLVKAMIFLVVMYGWESWTIKKAEH